MRCGPQGVSSGTLNGSRTNKAARRPPEQGWPHDISNHRPPRTGRKGKIMKKIINGKMYDTETAKEVASCYHGEGPRDFHYYSESLYRKRTGEYFLAGKGGPMSHYAVTVGQNSWSGGEKIIPLTYEEATEWAEREMSADDYQAEFGPVSEDDERVKLSVSLPADVADRIRKAAAAAGISVSECIASKF